MANQPRADNPHRSVRVEDAARSGAENNPRKCLTGVRTPSNVVLTRKPPAKEIKMHTTTAQNKAHRNDVQWIKSKGKSFTVNGEGYISEYLNPFTGQAIRKSWKMTGHDWFIFDTNGNVTGRAHSLTWAKFEAAA